MLTSPTLKPLNLQQFLALPETKPGQEFINGEIIQKPMPKGRHSRLQGKLCNVINNLVETSKVAYAFRLSGDQGDKLALLFLKAL